MGQANQSAITYQNRLKRETIIKTIMIKKCKRCFYVLKAKKKRL